MNEKLVAIYTVCLRGSPEVLYAGQTVNPKTRLNSLCGWSKFEPFRGRLELNIIMWVPESLANTFEERLIKDFKKLGQCRLNSDKPRHYWARMPEVIANGGTGRKWWQHKGAKENTLNKFPKTCALATAP